MPVAHAQMHQRLSPAMRPMGRSGPVHRPAQQAGWQPISKSIVSKASDRTSVARSAGLSGPGALFWVAELLHCSQPQSVPADAAATEWPSTSSSGGGGAGDAGVNGRGGGDGQDGGFSGQRAFAAADLRPLLLCTLCYTGGSAQHAPSLRYHCPCALLLAADNTATLILLQAAVGTPTVRRPSC